MMNTTERRAIRKAEKEIARLFAVMAANPSSEIIQVGGASMIEEQEHAIHILQN